MRQASRDVMLAQVNAKPNISYKDLQSARQLKDIYTLDVSKGVGLLPTRIHQVEQTSTPNSINIEAGLD